MTIMRFLLSRTHQMQPTSAKPFCNGNPKLKGHHPVLDDGLFASRFGYIIRWLRL